MVWGHGVLRIFWPLDTLRTRSPGVIVGWRNSESDLFVVTVLQDVEVLLLFLSFRWKVLTVLRRVMWITRCEWDTCSATILIL